jgi:hypothetical protein
VGLSGARCLVTRAQTLEGSTLTLSTSSFTTVMRSLSEITSWCIMSTLRITRGRSSTT